jgi:hypothetical protein
MWCDGVTRDKEQVGADINPLSVMNAGGGPKLERFVKRPSVALNSLIRRTRYLEPEAEAHLSVDGQSVRANPTVKPTICSVNTWYPPKLASCWL